jgi:DNA-binding transcriptional ArsR family regulator
VTNRPAQLASEQWDHALAEPERYGADASAPVQAAARRFERANARDLLELGAGQGRDTLLLARRVFDVRALDFSERGVRAIREQAVRAGLTDGVQPVARDVGEPLPFASESFDGCYSHMLYCMALTEAELRALNAEVHRVLRPGALNIYTVRTTGDPDYGQGVHHGEQLYETTASSFTSLTDGWSSGWLMAKTSSRSTSPGGIAPATALPRHPPQTHSVGLRMRRPVPALIAERLFSYSGDVAHGENHHEPSELDREFTQAVAETMQALATPSRLRILGRLRAGPSPVNELASAVGMEPSAVSHQLRLLRHLGLVVGRRDGRQVVYDLHDDHVGELLEQAISHVEHLRQGRSRATQQTELQEALR